jgi:hypothetical protein
MLIMVDEILFSKLFCFFFFHYYGIAGFSRLLEKVSEVAFLPARPRAWKRTLMS